MPREIFIFPRHHAVDERRRRVVRMFQQLIHWMAPDDFKRAHVIDRCFRHEDVLLYDDGNLVPLGLVLMLERAAEAAEIKNRYDGEKRHDVEEIRDGRRRKLWVRERRRHEPHPRKRARDGEVRHKRNDEHEAVILIEENVEEITLVCVMREPYQMIVNE